MQQLYRFELGFNDEPQDIGIFTGLKETGISEKTLDKLLAPFNKLMIPELNDLIARFWFTEDGLREFLPDIIEIRNALQKRGWQVLCLTVPHNPETCRYALYEDSFQIALYKAPPTKPMRFDIRKFKKFMPMKG